VPGYLSFREGPVLLEAFKKLRHNPDVVIFDGHGIAHSRRFGLASHLGLILDLPSIGCAKKKLIGSYSNPRQQKGSSCNLEDLKTMDRTLAVIGTVVRTRKKIKPVFVSVGHRISLELAVALVLKCCKKYRLPEPTRLAHREVNRLRVAWEKKPTSDRK
jgi:deoxyribonuclease V